MRILSLICAFILGALVTVSLQGLAQSRAGASPTATVTSLDKATHKTTPSGKAHIQILAQGKNAFVGRLRMAGGGAVPEHRDATEEFIHVVSGGGTITIDDKAHKIGPGTTVYMPANAKVTYQNGPDEIVAIQVFAGPEPAAKYAGWKTVKP